MDAFRSADYSDQDSGYTTPVHFVRLTTTELTALATAKKVGIGTLYYDVTLGAFRLGIDAGTLSAHLTIAGLPSAATITGGTINGTSVGATTRAAVSATLMAVTATDSTGTPGNVTNNSANGRAAFAAAGSSVVVTSGAVAATDTVQVTLLGAADATLLYVAGVTVSAGSFTVTGNAPATATKGFMFTVIKS